MPGPKMGPRPADFNEDLVKKSPTFHKWLELEPGEKLRYACRDFVKGHDQDEERLMRRIMIARRNNLRDHAILKQARRITDSDGNASDATPVVKVEELVSAPAPAPAARKRRPACTFTDGQVMQEMDVAAVEATRSYRAWNALQEGEEFVYNQKYIKGKDDHDWLLRKNIWRRMRYRRENKKMVKELTKLAEDDPTLVPTKGTSKTISNGQQPPPPKTDPPTTEPELPRSTVNQAPTRDPTAQQQPTASEIVDQALSPLEATNQVAHTHAAAIKNDADEPPPLHGMGNTEAPPVETGAGVKRDPSDAEADTNMKPAKVAKMEPDTSVAAPATVNPLDINVMNPLPNGETHPVILPESADRVHQQEPGLESTVHHHHHHADHHHHHHHHHHAELPPHDSNEHHPQHHPHHDDAALTAAAAATASGAADDLVELSAVEAAVAAAASYVQYQNEGHGDEDDDDDDDDENMHHQQNVVHNPLEAAANAAALDSAAKLAAAAAQPGNDTEHDEAMQVVLDTEDMLMQDDTLGDEGTAV